MANAGKLMNWEIVVQFSFLKAALAGSVVLFAVADASAWTRQSSVTTARGTYRGSAVGNCAGGVCNRAATVIGPKGRTVNETGTLMRTGPGQYSYTGNAIGPNGGVANTTGNLSKTGPGQYGYTSNTTGPNGGSVERSGSIVIVRPPQ
jgi:glycine/D-amino acid oxidase-like deaminating enzyme